MVFDIICGWDMVSLVTVLIWHWHKIPAATGSNVSINIWSHLIIRCFLLSHSTFFFRIHFCCWYQSPPSHKVRDYGFEYWTLTEKYRERNWCSGNRARESFSKDTTKCKRAHALCYKPEGSGFDTRWGEFLNLPNPSGPTRPWGLLNL
jgi:hypothetical protein